MTTDSTDAKEWNSVKSIFNLIHTFSMSAVFKNYEDTLKWFDIPEFHLETHHFRIGALLVIISI